MFYFVVSAKEYPASLLRRFADRRVFLPFGKASAFLRANFFPKTKVLVCFLSSRFLPKRASPFYGGFSAKSSPRAPFRNFYGTRFPADGQLRTLAPIGSFFLSDLKICSRRGVHAELFCVLFAYGIFFAQPRSGLRPAHVPAENLSAFSLGTLFHTAFFPILRNKRSGGNFPLRFKHPGNFGRLNSFAPLHVGPSDFPPR